MGKLKKYIPVALSLFVSLAAMVLLLAMIFEPGRFSLLAGGQLQSLTQSADTPKHPVVKPDSLRTGNVSQEAAKNSRGDRQDSSAVRSEIRALSDTGGNTQKLVRRDSSDASTTHSDKSASPPAASRITPDPLNDSEIKQMVQIFESMDAESAAKILHNMDDHVVKHILTVMKKRQSAKILATLDPQQAARILKGILE